MSDKSHKTQIIVAIITLVSAVLVAIISTQDNFFTTDSDTPTSPVTPPLASPPNLNGLHIDTIESKLAEQGLKVGDIAKHKAWFDDSYVINQSPTDDKQVEHGSSIDVVVADSDFKFRVEREITGKDESFSVITEYQVKRLRSSDDINSMGEFIITRAEFIPEKTNFQKIINNLIHKPGYFPINIPDSYKFENSWQALSELGQELGEDIAIDVIKETSDNSSLGKTVITSLISMEVEFDIRAIFTEAPNKNNTGHDAINLQAGNNSKSTIRVEGPSTISATGAEHIYKIVRRMPKSSEYKNVGNATYTASDGLIKTLYARFHIGDEKENLYVLKINRI